MKPVSNLLLIIIGLALSLNAFSQDPSRFKVELQPIIGVNPENTNSGQIIFTGSSSFKMWTNVGEYFPEKQILNHGFGGSEMSDLLYYADDLILKFKPSKILIYEGDNDINSGDKPEDILREANKLVQAIRKTLPEVGILFLAAKPSIARWHLKQEYLTFNDGLKRFCNENNLVYVDVWSVMLDDQGNLKKGLFIEDGLHMNVKGYDLWAGVIKDYL